jgi:hypothetical protein
MQAKKRTQGAVVVDPSTPAPGHGRHPEMTIGVWRTPRSQDRRAVVNVATDWQASPVDAMQLIIGLQALGAQTFVLERQRVHGPVEPTAVDLLDVCQVASPANAHGLEMEDYVLIWPAGERYSFLEHGIL